MQEEEEVNIDLNWGEVLGELIRQDMVHVQFTEDMVLDKNLWRSKIMIKDCD